MEYIIISLLSISLITYIVYIVANRILAINMHIKFLILCACCALLINLILPRIFVGFAGLTGTLGIVTIFAIISSYCISYYYDNTMQKELLESALAATSVEVLEEPQIDQEETIQLIPSLEATWPQPSLQVPAEECSTADDEPLEQKKDHIIAEPTSAYFLGSENVILPNDPNKIIQINNAEKAVDIIADTKPITESMDKKYFYPIKYEERERNIVPLERNQMIKPTNSEILLSDALKIRKGANILKNKMKLKQKRINRNTPLILANAHEHLDAPISNEPLIIYQESVNENVTMLEDEHLDNDVSQELIILPGDLLPENTDLKVVLEDSYPSSDDLDVLMDFAFLQKEQRNFVQALKFFRQALTLYPDSEACPFLVMEIGTILKNLGSYNEAIAVFSEGRLLFGVINNSMLEQEFINNIAYLRIVKNILIQNSLEFMPFNLIPENAFNEINAEFSEWRNQS